MLNKNHCDHLYPYFSNLTFDGLEFRFCGVQYFENQVNLVFHEFGKINCKLFLPSKSIKLYDERSYS